MNNKFIMSETPLQPKPGIQQKNTWLGLALLGFGIWNIITGNVTDGITSVTAGIGLVFSIGS